jgi:Uma2 family endonuclease
MPRSLDPDIIVPPSKRGEPAWALATLFPTQGQWSEEDYFRLETDNFIELVDGCIEVLPMPPWLHQRIVAFLYQSLSGWCVSHRRGEALFAPLPLKLFPGTIREPDILVIKRSPNSGRLAQYPTSAILVAEVVGDDSESRCRDLSDKRHDYAMAGIPEYWIIDPVEKLITVLTLDAGKYREHGRFTTGQTATSCLLADFAISTDEIWALEQEN